MYKPTKLPILPSEENPFDDEFKAKWWQRYKDNGCTIEHLQRLYNIDKLTKEDFITITGQDPGEKVVVSGKIKQLEKKIVALQESQTAQDMDIMFTQEAVDFLMLGSMATKLNNNIKLGGSNMAGYIATRIIKKGNISVEAGRDYYVTFLTHSDYAQYKTEVDLILRAEGRENLIVDLTNM